MRGIVAKDGDGSVDDGILEPGFFALYEKKEPFVASGEFFALGSGCPSRQGVRRNFFFECLSEKGAESGEKCVFDGDERHFFSKPIQKRRGSVSG